MTTAQSVDTPQPSETQAATAATSAASFKRGYIACDGCKSRKVRCVLGSKPPCAKCQREHRECVFQTQRKTRRHREAPKWAQRDSGVAAIPDHHDFPEIGSASHLQDNYGKFSATGAPTTQQQQQQPNPSPSVVSSTRRDSQAGDSTVSNDRVMTTFLTKPSDALNVLFDAAQPRTPGSRAILERPLERPKETQVSFSSENFSNIISESGQVSVSQLSQPSEDILDLWDRFRFVRQGWFTAQEAVTYLDLYVYDS